MYILVKGTITVRNTAVVSTEPKNRKEKVTIKNCTPFTDCISEINNSLVKKAKDIDVVMPMYSLVEYSDSCAKTSGRSWQYFKDESALDANWFYLITVFRLNLNKKQKVKQEMIQ